MTPVEQLQYDLITMRLKDIDKFRQDAEDLIYKHINPKFCMVDIIGELYIEGSFSKEQYASLMLCQHMFSEGAKIINYRELTQNESKRAD